MRHRRGDRGCGPRSFRRIPVRRPRTVALTRAATRIGLLAVLGAASLLSTGCVTEADPRSASGPGAGRSSGRAPVSSTGAGTTEVPRLPDGPIGARVDDVRSLEVRLALQPLGAIPHDGFTLPLVRPDGRRIAAATGFAPEWSTVLAERGASLPAGSQIEVLHIPAPQPAGPARSGPPPEVTPAFAIREPLLLGRFCNEQGFLVESPRPNGARWIGLADWDTGAVTWLVADDSRVSAFAALGPGGLLAWSSRAIDSENFELHVRAGTERWRLATGQRSWLLPVWSGRGAGLFALVVDNGRIEAVHMDAGSESAALRSVRRLPLAASGATVETAYQAVVGAIGHLDDRGIEQLFFVHPGSGRPSIWRPNENLLALDATAITAAPDPRSPDIALVTTRTQLQRQSLTRARDREDLLRGLHVVRSADPRTGECILLEPGEGRMGVVRLILLPVD